MRQARSSALTIGSRDTGQSECAPRAWDLAKDMEQGLACRELLSSEAAPRAFRCADMAASFGMQPDQLLALWTRPTPGTGSGAYDVRDRLGSCFVGVSSAGTPALIVPLDDGPRPRGKVLGSVRVRYESSLDFELDGGPSWSQPAAVIDCLEPEVLATFCCLARDLAAGFDGPSATARDVAAVMASWDALLRRRPPLSGAEELGLFGELCVIAESDRPDAMVAAWRGPMRDTLDFVGSGVALEVKTSTRLGVHQIGQRQVRSEASTLEAYLVSVWVTDDPTGSTLGEKVDHLAERLADPDAFLKKLVSLGYRENHRQAYERRLHFIDVRAYPMASIPRVREVDPGVSEIRYTVDVSESIHVGEEQWRRLIDRVATRDPE